jgi:hypothetical protein
MPASKMGGGAFWYPYGFAGKLVGDGFLFDGSYGNFLMVTNAGGYVANDTYGAHFLRPEDAWSIDTKMDDGKPGTGSIIGSRWLYCTTGAATSADVTLATYIFNGPSSTAYCVLVFRNAF